MANVLFWCFGGAILGWLTSLVIGAKRRLGTLRDVSVGASGAVLTGWLMPNLLGAGLIQLSDFNAPALCAALLGALLCLAGGLRLAYFLTSLAVNPALLFPALPAGAQQVQHFVVVRIPWRSRFPRSANARRG